MSVGCCVRGTGKGGRDSWWQGAVGGAVGAFGVKWGVFCGGGMSGFSGGVWVWGCVWVGSLVRVCLGLSGRVGQGAGLGWRGLVRSWEGWGSLGWGMEYLCGMSPCCCGLGGVAGLEFEMVGVRWEGLGDRPLGEGSGWGGRELGGWCDVMRRVAIIDWAGTGLSRECTKIGWGTVSLRSIRVRDRYPWETGLYGVRGVCLGMVRDSGMVGVEGGLGYRDGGYDDSRELRTLLEFHQTLTNGIQLLFNRLTSRPTISNGFSTK
ncbi:hypothetical protein Tco_0630503 [Tanacetum coccineum]